MSTPQRRSGSPRRPAAPPLPAPRTRRTPVSIESELSELREPLLRFARLQLRHDSAAEDVVSETLLAILEKPGDFEGRSSLRTYATSILRFKIVDLLRRRGRELHVESMDEQGLDAALESLFAQDGHWQDPPQPWQQPDQALERAQLLQTLQACVERLPPRVGRVFMMREWLDREVAEICAELGITSNHCGVMLYRARMQLRECLDLHGFAGLR